MSQMANFPEQTVVNELITLGQMISTWNGAWEHQS